MLVASARAAGACSHPPSCRYTCLSRYTPPLSAPCADPFPPPLSLPTAPAASAWSFAEATCPPSSTCSWVGSKGEMVGGGEHRVLLSLECPSVFGGGQHAPAWSAPSWQAPACRVSSLLRRCVRPLIRHSNHLTHPPDSPTPTPTPPTHLQPSTGKCSHMAPRCCTAHLC